MDQLADDHLLRLWKTGGDPSLHTAEDDECDESTVSCNFA